MSDKLPWGRNVEGVAPGSTKNISSLKLKAFNIGTMNVRKGMSKKEQEEMKKREEEDAAKVYEEFVESFEDTGKSINRSWIKGGVVNPDKEKLERGAYGGRLYKPMTKLAEQSLSKNSPGGSSSKSAIDKAKLKKGTEKKKSNLELFKEELQKIQEERQERRRVKAGGAPSAVSMQDSSRKSRFDPVPEPPALGTSLGIGLEDTIGSKSGSYTYTDDAMTTNLYLGNINPKMSEASLCELFGKFGPLASVKIMWPRSEEERQRNRNCGFVAYMNRKDGERALNNLQGKDIDGFEMKLGWGKAVPIPPHPVYVPPALAELTLPPPPSGLPFNCQPTQRNSGRRAPFPTIPGPDRPDSEHAEFNKILANAVVKVVIPTERALLQLIHRVIEFVVREGPMFEAMIMNREMNNVQYRFLFENQSPAHVYYRWKLFSILQGDSPYSWRTQPFNMFAGGSVWQPPPMDPYTQGMPDELLAGGAGDARLDDPRRGTLSESQRDRLEDMLRELTPERQKVGDAMVWCLEHAESAEEVVECLAESLSLLETPLPKKIARIYLVSDVLHNCSAKVPHASYYRKFFEVKLKEIFRDMHEYYEKISGRLKAEQFKNRVMGCFRAWEDWAVYPNDLLIKLQNIFLGLVNPAEEAVEEEESTTAAVVGAEVDGAPMDVDGIPLDVDGEPLHPRASESADHLDGMPMGVSDVDGMPLKEDDGPEQQEDVAASKFVRSKWETVDESELEAQAVTTSKWDLLEQEGESAPSPEPDDDPDNDVDGAPLTGDDDEDGESMTSSNQAESNFDETSQDRHITEERRAKLREIELKVMKYQDELEAGKRTRKPDMTVAQQLSYYRTKLLNKEEEKEREKIRDKEREKRRKEEEIRIKEWERAREKEREREREKQERERDRLVKQIRDLSRSERSDRSERSERAERSERSERGNERRSRRERSESSPDPSPARGSLGQLMRGYGGSTSRSPSPASSSRSRGRRGDRSPSPYSRSSSRRGDRSPSPRQKAVTVKSRSPSAGRRSAAKRSRSRTPPRHKHKKHKSRH